MTIDLFLTLVFGLFALEIFWRGGVAAFGWLRDWNDMRESVLYEEDEEPK